MIKITDEYYYAVAHSLDSTKKEVSAQGTHFTDSVDHSNIRSMNTIYHT